MGQSTPLRPHKPARDEVERLMAHTPPAQYGEIAGDDDPNHRDFVARGLAREALANISSHERLCSERDDDAKRRWEDTGRMLAERHATVMAAISACEARQVAALTSLDNRTTAGFGEVKNQLAANQNSETAFRSGVNNRFLLMYGAVIFTLIGAVGFLVSKLLFH